MKAEADFEMTRSLMTQILAHFLKTIFDNRKKKKLSWLVYCSSICFSSTALAGA